MASEVRQLAVFLSSAPRNIKYPEVEDSQQADYTAVDRYRNSPS